MVGSQISFTITILNKWILFSNQEKKLSRNYIIAQNHSSINCWSSEGSSVNAFKVHPGCTHWWSNVTRTAVIDMRSSRSAKSVKSVDSI